MRMRPAMFAAAVAAAVSAGAPGHAQEPLVVVPNRVIYPGETVTSEAIDEVPLRRRLPNPSAIVYQREQVEGRIARRTLLPGRLVAVNAVREAYLVEAGSPVQVNFVHGGLTISIAGVPLQPGAAGDLIRVRNTDSGAVFNGTVMADGTIRVTAS